MDKFERGVNEAYDVLWRMFEKKYDWTDKEMDKLLKMLNFIDDTMGR